jgi:hypothetical protein
MDPNYRATDKQWRFIEDEASRAGFSSSSCILELRARIEALEAAQQLADHIPDAKKMVAPATEESSATAPPAPAGGLVKRVAHLLAMRFSESRPGTDCTPFAGDVLREVAAAAEQMAPDKNLTWERVRLWLEVEAIR